MGAEIGATTSLFPYNKRMYDYLVATKRGEIGEQANKYKELLSPDKGIYSKIYLIPNLGVNNMYTDIKKKWIHLDILQFFVLFKCSLVDSEVDFFG